MNGIHGKVLVINLSTNEIKTRTDIGEEIWRKYLGASGIAAHLFLKEFDVSVDPLAPEAPMFWMTGLLTGTIAPTGCKFSVCCKSPLTGIWNESTGGGQFGAMFKFTGYDGMILVGKAEKPSFIYITDEGVEIRSAEEAWGMPVIEAEEWMRAHTDDKAQVAVVGPAAEKGVKYAGIMTDGAHTRAAARCGAGTVLASKNIKAVVVKGKKRPAIHDMKGFAAHVKEYNNQLREMAIGMYNFGTSGGIMGVEANGDLPIKNWYLGSWKEGAEKISAQKMHADGYLEGHHACFACPIRCAKSLVIKDEKYSEYLGKVIPQQEYETSAGFGANLLNDDPQSITVANYLCNQYGLDTMSTAACIAFAFEAFEKGVITTEDTGGLELKWGDTHAIHEMIKMIGERKHIGELLGEGVRKASQVLGKGTEEYAVHVKGLELAFHDPRGFTSMGAGYATSNRGGCHLETLSYFAEQGVLFKEFGYDKENNPFAGRWGEQEGKARLAKLQQDYMNSYNALGLCKFAFRAGTPPTIVLGWINYVTGWNMTLDEYLLAAERLHTLKRIFNVKLGISAKDDVLPPRVGQWAKQEGKAKGQLPDMKKLLPEYYELRGWDANGIPTKETLERLGLTEYDMTPVA